MSLLFRKFESPEHVQMPLGASLPVSHKFLVSTASHTRAGFSRDRLAIWWVGCNLATKPESLRVAKKPEIPLARRVWPTNYRRQLDTVVSVSQQGGGCETQPMNVWNLIEILIVKDTVKSIFMMPWMRKLKMT
eukprot:g46603.t1